MNTVGLLAYGNTAPHALNGLIKNFSVPWIITPSQTEEALLPVEQLAKEYNIPFHRTNSNKQIQILAKETCPDAVVISSYNKILEQELLNSSKFINIHHGDLPRFRGRANSNWAIILGRTEIGLTFHETITDLDAGRIYAQYIVPIKKEDTVKTIYDKFNEIIEKELAIIVNKVLNGYTGEEQKGNPTYCCTRLPNDGLIDWTKTTEEIHNLIRAVTFPFPGAFTYFEGKRMIILNSKIPTNGRIYEGRIPGRVVSLQKEEGVEVLTGDGSILIDDVVYDGHEKKAIDIIKTVKISLGIDIVEMYEQLQRMQKI